MEERKLVEEDSKEGYPYLHVSPSVFNGDYFLVSVHAIDNVFSPDPSVS